MFLDAANSRCGMLDMCLLRHERKPLGGRAHAGCTPGWQVEHVSATTQGWDLPLNRTMDLTKTNSTSRRRASVPTSGGRLPLKCDGLVTE
jgi:hypothetical protein